MINSCVPMLVLGHGCIDVTPSLSSCSKEVFQQKFTPGNLISTGPATFSGGGCVPNVSGALTMLGNGLVYACCPIVNDEFGEILQQQLQLVTEHVQQREAKLVQQRQNYSSDEKKDDPLKSWTTRRRLSSDGFAVRRIDCHDFYCRPRDQLTRFLLTIPKNNKNKTAVRMGGDENQELLQHTSYSIVISPQGVDRIILHCPGVNMTISSSAFLSSPNSTNSSPLLLLAALTKKTNHHDNNGERNKKLSSLDLIASSPSSSSSSSTPTIRSFLQRKLFNVIHFGYPPVLQKLCLRNNGEDFLRLLEFLHTGGGGRRTNEEEEEEGGMMKFSDLLRNFPPTISLDMTSPDAISPTTTVTKKNRKNFEEEAINFFSWKQFFKNVLPKIHIFTPSIEEMVMCQIVPPSHENLQKDTNGMVHLSYLRSLSSQLLSDGVPMVLLKLGPHGLYFRSQEKLIEESQAAASAWKAKTDKKNQRQRLLLLWNQMRKLGKGFLQVPCAAETLEELLSRPQESKEEGTRKDTQGEKAAEHEKKEEDRVKEKSFATTAENNTSGRDILHSGAGEALSLEQQFEKMKAWSNVELYAPSFDVHVAGTLGAGDCTISAFLSCMCCSVETARHLHAIENQEVLPKLKTEEDQRKENYLKNKSRKNIFLPSSSSTSLQGCSNRDYLLPSEVMTLACATGASNVEELDALTGLKSLLDIQRRIYHRPEEVNRNEEKKGSSLLNSNLLENGAQVEEDRIQWKRRTESLSTHLLAGTDFEKEEVKPDVYGNYDLRRFHFSAIATTNNSHL